MNANVNLEAGIGALTLLGSCFVLLLAGAVFAHALWRRKFARARKVVLAAAAFGALYVGGMIAFSLASSEKVLGRGEEKYFCEIDCHLAYSVVGIRRAKTVGKPPDEAVAAGEFHVVSIRTRFDEDTITPRRGDWPLTPNPRVVTLFDGQGRKFFPSTEAAGALERAGEAGKPLSTPLRPSESYTTELVFDLPADARGLSLLVNESGLPTRFIIGHENSLLHKRTRFDVEPRAGETARGL